MNVDDFGFHRVDAAMDRYTELVLADARRAGTTIAVWRDGRVVSLHPDEFERIAQAKRAPTRP